MPLRLNGSTSGFSQLDAPAIAGDQTFTLPGTGGTIDRLNRAGNILQVVSATYSTIVTVASTSATDTGLSAAITPSSSSSKILILISQAFLVQQDTSAANIGHNMVLLRSGTPVFTNTDGRSGAIAATWNSSISRLQASGYFSLHYLDSPSTTSSVTYKTQGSATFTSSSGLAQYQPNSNTSTIVLLEVAA